ncbi:GNAT family N-acetyltransferase, partial [candidate division KSB1 bacterium]
MSDTPAEIQIVPMAANHLAPVLKIEKTVFRDSWTASSFLEVIRMSDKSWVALSGEGVAGYLVTQWVLDEVHILNLAVTVPMQRQGIAAKLMQFLIDLCGNSGMRDLFLEVRVSNLPAISLY